MKQKILIIGAGFTGLACALELAISGNYEVLLVESGNEIGGLGGGISNGYGQFDYGSHRLHRNMVPSAGQLFTRLGCTFESKARRGKLRLNNAYMRYPPSLFGLISCLGISGAGKACLSYMARHNNSDGKQAISYEDVLRRSVGDSIYRWFYQPYAQKVYGTRPSAISHTAVKRRFSTGDAERFFAKSIVRSFIGDTFLYPGEGFAALAQKLGQQLRKAGGIIHTSCKAIRIIRNGTKATSCVIDTPEGIKNVDFDWIVNTSPIDEQTAFLYPSPNTSIREEAKLIKWRSLRLLYVISKKKRRPSGPDTLYFPELNYPFGRISFPARFSADMGSPLRESMCIEVICSEGDELWKLNRDDLAQICFAATEHAGILGRQEAHAWFTQDFAKVYPVYGVSWQRSADKCLSELCSMQNYLPAGRMGLFLHCNIDHAVTIGIAAAQNILSNLPASDWQMLLSTFSKYRVRD